MMMNDNTDLPLQMSSSETRGLGDFTFTGPIHYPTKGEGTIRIGTQDDHDRIVRNLCYLMCELDGVDPEKYTVGCGGLIPKDEKYQLWQAREKMARAIIDRMGEWYVC